MGNPFYLVLSHPLYSGNSVAILDAMGFFILGAATLLIGFTLRNRALQRLAFRSCPSRQRMKLVIPGLPGDCRTCGAPLPVSPVTP